MEVAMRDMLLQCAGLAVIVVALIHGLLGETTVFARASIAPERLRTLLRLVWQAGTVAWIGYGLLLIAAPWMGSEPARIGSRSRPSSCSRPPPAPMPWRHARAISAGSCSREPLCSPQRAIEVRRTPASRRLPAPIGGQCFAAKRQCAAAVWQADERS